MLQNVDYCPILHVRVAETKALFHLPAATKDRIFPVLVGRPWPNAKALTRAWEKIGEAMGGRRFALDLDGTKYRAGGATPAAAEFDALFDPGNGYENYYGELVEVPLAVPVMRIADGSIQQLDAQVEHVDALDRGVVLRLQYGCVTRPAELVRQVLDRVEDVAVVIDAGWSSDLLGREAWASTIIGAITEVQPEAEIILSGSSFPDSFTSVGHRGEVDVVERGLHARLTRRHNAARIVYGDWGSTRPPATESVPMRNIPRIDLPTTREWICFRRDGEEGYPEIADRLISDPEWPEQLQIWGTYTIQCTAEDLPGAIRSPGTAAAARINIHMHRQAHFDAGVVVNDGDEPFTDD